MVADALEDAGGVAKALREVEDPTKAAVEQFRQPPALHTRYLWIPKMAMELFTMFHLKRVCVSYIYIYIHMSHVFVSVSVYISDCFHLVI